MIAETYTCSLNDGRIEYGYTFKLEPGADDTEFDIRLGVTLDHASIDAEFEKFEASAARIAAALS